MRKYINRALLNPARIDFKHMKNKQDKVRNIDKWTDCFFVYSSIYFVRHLPETRSMLKYAAMIRKITFRQKCGVGNCMTSILQNSVKKGKKHGII